MLWYAVKRLIGFAVTLLLAAAAVFFMLDILPGDPARFLLGVTASQETVDALRLRMGLEAPAWDRFLAWLAGAVQGDLGTSYVQNQPVLTLIAERAQLTLLLASAAMAISILVGLPIGILAARRRGSPTDTALMTLAQLGIAVPNFWFGMLLVLLFSVTLRWLPSGGYVDPQADLWGAARSLVLPSLALALPQAAIIARVMRTALVDVQNADFIRTARAKGLTQGEAIWRHGVRNALVPVVTILGLQFAFLIAGTVIVENVFYLPGLGRLIFTAISQRDLILVRGAVMILIVAVTVVLLVVDLTYSLIDPRIRTGAVP